jgi:hypothetical protein
MPACRKHLQQQLAVQHLQQLAKTALLQQQRQQLWQLKQQWQLPYNVLMQQQQPLLPLLQRHLQQQCSQQAVRVLVR